MNRFLKRRARAQGVAGPQRYHIREAAPMRQWFLEQVRKRLQAKWARDCQHQKDAIMFVIHPNDPLVPELTRVLKLPHRPGPAQVTFVALPRPTAIRLYGQFAPNENDAIAALSEPVPEGEFLVIVVGWGGSLVAVVPESGSLRPQERGN